MTATRRLLILLGGLLVALALLPGLYWLGSELLRPIPPTPTVTPTPAPTAVGGTDGLIAFVSTRDGNSEIYVMNADGSGQRNLTNDPAEDLAPVWSPDGRRLAFLRLSSSGSHLFTVYPNGSGLTLVAQSPGAGFVSWSPNGERLILAQLSRQGSSWVTHWLQVRADGSGAITALFENLPSDCSQVRSSPDSAHFVALCHSEGRDTLWLVTEDGSITQAIAQGVRDFDWAPDGRRLAFLTDDWTLAVFDLALGEWMPLRRLEDVRRHYISELRWSPDGTRLVFSAGVFGASDIYLLWADGSGLVRLTRDGFNNSPAWSPDGKWLAYASSVNAMPTAGVFTGTTLPSAIYVVNIEDAFRNPASLQPVQLTFTGRDNTPQWQP